MALSQEHTIIWLGYFVLRTRPNGPQRWHLLVPQSCLVFSNDGLRNKDGRIPARSSHGAKAILLVSHLARYQ